MSKILILGAGNAQADAIRHCRELGHEVHACSSSANDADKRLADNFAAIDIADMDGISNYADKNKINYIYSVGSDLAMPSVSAVSEKLGLPHFVTYKTALICQNKAKLRLFLGNDFKGNVPHRTIKNKNDIGSWADYPCVLKPTDNQGQRGVYKLENKDDFHRYYERSMEHSLNKALIIEKYIDGPEISVNAYVRGEQIMFFQISERISFAEYPGGIIKEHIIPSAAIDRATEREVRDLTGRVIEKLGISDGPVYFQMKMHEGDPFLIEAAPRLDGCHLWRLIRQYRGIDLLDITFKHLIERKCDVNSGTKAPAGRYSLVFLCEKPGGKVDRNKYDIKDAIFLKWYYEQGETVRPINGYMEKVGCFISGHAQNKKQGK